MEKLREEIAIIIHEGFRSDVKAGAMADDVLSLLAPVFEKAEKWDAYQTDLINEKAHTERFIKLMDAEEGELRRKAEKWRKVEEIAASEGCEQCVVKTPCAGASHTVCSVARGIIIILKETP